jgi:hypothetical protein
VECLATVGWVILALLILAALCSAAYLLSRRRSPPTQRPLRPAPVRSPQIQRHPAEPEDSYRVLVTMLLGDRLKADRLIEFEASKTPGASRAQCIDNAIELLRNDLRR